MSGATTSPRVETALEREILREIERYTELERDVDDEYKTLYQGAVLGLTFALGRARAERPPP